MTRSLYLVGGPGAGKSTLMARLLAPWDIEPCERLTEKELFGHRMTDADGCVGVYLGRIREQFPGTDALSMSVSPVAAAWAEQDAAGYDVILGEGGRLATRRFLDALSASTSLLVVHLAVDFDTARERTLSRPDANDWKPVSRKGPDGHWHRVARTNRPQADTHLKAGASKAAKIAEEYPSVTINTTNMTPDEVEETLCLIW